MYGYYCVISHHISCDLCCFFMCCWNDTENIKQFHCNVTEITGYSIIGILSKMKTLLRNESFGRISRLSLAIYISTFSFLISIHGILEDTVLQLELSLPPLLLFYGLPMVFSTVHVLSQSWTALCPPRTRLRPTVIPPHSNINQHTP